jgi:hypothetical protein
MTTAFDIRADILGGIGYAPIARMPVADENRRIKNTNKKLTWIIINKKTILIVDKRAKRELNRIMTQATWNSGQTWNQNSLVWGISNTTKGNKMNAHVSLAFKQDKDPQLIPDAQKVHDGLAANTTKFNNLPVTLIALLAAIADFTTKYNLSRKGSEAQTGDKEAAKVVLIGLLATLAAYVEGVAQGDPDVIRLAGFVPVDHSHSPQVPLVKPRIIAALNHAAGEIQLRLQAQPNVHGVKVQYRSAAGAWQDGGGFSSTKLVIVKGLTSGTLYDFRVQYIGGSEGSSEWSDIVSHICT